ncbi:hypothetical protein GNL24_23740, partial [Salmonella enterica]|nr:hypothetical protein [Salmonella enterica]
ARQYAAGERKLELVLDGQELEMLSRNCAARRPGRAPPVALVVRRPSPWSCAVRNERVHRVADPPG